MVPPYLHILGRGTSRTIANPGLSTYLASLTDRQPPPFHPTISASQLPSQPVDKIFVF